MARRPWLVAVTTGAIALCGMTSAAVGGPAHPAAHKKPSALALLGSGGTSYSAVSGLLGGPLSVAKATPAKGFVTGTAFTPSGNSALLSQGQHEVYAISNITRKPSLSTINLKRFRREGGTGYGAYTDGVAISNDAALVTIDSQGVVQLRLVKNNWKVDTRVHSPGLNEVGKPHKPGLIRFPLGSSAAKIYNGVAVSSVPMPDGNYLGLSIGRGGSQSLEVISGVGTAKARAVAQVTGPQLGPLTGTDRGNGGMAFEPSSGSRAVIATPTGFDVLDLSNPKAPKWLPPTTVAPTGQILGVAISPDGNTVAVGTNGSVTFYSGLLHDKGALQQGGSVTPDTTGSYFIEAMSYLPNGTLVVARSGNDTVNSKTGYYLSLIKGGDTIAPKVTKSVQLAGPPEAPNGLSTTPGRFASISPASLAAGSKGAKYAAKLRVTAGIGSYHFTVVKGSLPAGLSLAHNKISGTPKKAGTSKITLRAVNQYGGAVFSTLKLKIK